MEGDENQTVPEQPTEPRTFTIEQVQILIREAQANQQRWIYLDLAFRECLNHMKPLCTATKEYPIPAYDPQVYVELDALFDQVRSKYLGTQGSSYENRQD